MAFKLFGIPIGPAGKKTGKGLSTATTILDTAPVTPAAPAKPAAKPGAAPKLPVSALTLRMRILGGVFVVFAGCAVALLFYQNQQAAHLGSQIKAAGEMRTLSQQMAKAAQLVVRGDAQALTELRSSRDRFGQLYGALREGGIIDGNTLPLSPEAMQAPLEALGKVWQRSSQDAATLAKLDKAQLTAFEASRLMERDGARLLELGSLLGALRQQGGAADMQARLQQLEALQQAFAQVAAVQPQLAQGRQAAERIVADAGELLRLSQQLVDAYADREASLQPLTYGVLLLGLMGLLALARIAKIYNDDLAARSREAERQRLAAEEERNKSQQAILRLMNEMGDLADGDLTVRTTVTEDITGAIADSVNYTIEELSVLVRRINDAATRVTAATESAQRTSSELLAATERQSTEIRGAGSTVQRMAGSMSESSSRAAQSAQVARRSLEAARKGADAVTNTIKGMNAIRDKIQETSKRIKRLGESSQEIGEIVELISDITEQTNVLALNAAIQAASAGEAGRGFTVVAEEVQRLAERSAEATKQIGAIVKTIQTDTQDAVGAMEIATRDVVEGAQLSDAAGQALMEIEQVVTETARLIEEISTSTQRQAAAATHVAESMKGILAVTEQTTRGTQQTAVSIGQLADLAIELKGSVSGFKV